MGLEINNIVVGAFVRHEAIEGSVTSDPCKNYVQIEDQVTITSTPHGVCRKKSINNEKKISSRKTDKKPSRSVQSSPTISSLLPCNHEGFIHGMAGNNEPHSGMKDGVPLSSIDWKHINLTPEDITSCKQKASRIFDEFYGIGFPSKPKPPEVTRYALHHEEAEAIKVYTSRAYRYANPILRGLNSNDYSEEEIRPFCALVASGLNKLPDFQGVIYRCLSSDKRYQDSCEPGSIITEPTFISCSHDKEKAAYFLRKPVENKIMFVLHSKTGKCVENLAVGKNEREVLFLPGTRFRVFGKTEKIFDEKDFPHWTQELCEPVKGKRITYITLEEIA